MAEMGKDSQFGMGSLGNEILESAIDVASSPKE